MFNPITVLLPPLAFPSSSHSLFLKTTHMSRRLKFVSLFHLSCYYYHYYFTIAFYLLLTLMQTICGMCFALRFFLTRILFLFYVFIFIYFFLINILLPPVFIFCTLYFATGVPSDYLRRVMGDRNLGLPYEKKGFSRRK